MSHTAYFLSSNERDRLSTWITMIGKPPEWSDLDYVRFVNKESAAITVTQLKQLNALHYLTFPMLKGEVRIRVFEESSQ